MSSCKPVSSPYEFKFAALEAAGGISSLDNVLTWKNMFWK